MNYFKEAVTVAWYRCLCAIRGSCLQFSVLWPDLFGDSVDLVLNVSVYAPLDWTTLASSSIQRYGEYLHFYLVWKLPSNYNFWYRVFFLPGPIGCQRCGRLQGSLQSAFRWICCCGMFRILLWGRNATIGGGLWEHVKWFFFSNFIFEEKNAHKINRGVMCGPIAWIEAVNDPIPIRIDISMPFARTLVQAEPSKLVNSMHISVSFYWNQTM